MKFETKNTLSALQASDLCRISATSFNPHPNACLGSLKPVTFIRVLPSEPLCIKTLSSSSKSSLPTHKHACEMKSSDHSLRYSPCSLPSVWPRWSSEALLVCVFCICICAHTGTPCMPDRIVASLAEGVLMRRQEYLPSCIDAHTPSHTQYTHIHCSALLFLHDTHHTQQTLCGVRSHL